MNLHGTRRAGRGGRRAQATEADGRGPLDASLDAETRSRDGGAAPGGSARREAKFRQAAFVYLHVGLLYEAAVWSMAQAGLLPEARGPVWVWLLMGAAIVAVVFWGLWSWQNRWFARAVWVLHSLRLPALVEGAFFPAEASHLPGGFYLTALVVVLVNLAFLARAGWDL